MAAIAADWLRRIPATATTETLILDAGCGTGGGLRWLAQFGHPCGVDLHPLPLRLASEQGARRLVRADSQALPFTADRFHIVTSFDVLYHLNITDDRIALREFARVLRPGGWLLLRLPAFDWLRSAHDRIVHTRHRYTRREVRDKLHAAGLEPVRVTFANTLLFLPAVLWRLLTRHRAASDVVLPPAPINQALAALLRAEMAWLRCFNLPIGLSILALARKGST